MCDATICHQCGQRIEIDQHFARMKNRTVGEIGYIYFHQRGRGDCYWRYLRDSILKPKKLEQMGTYQFT
jgi:hypothetical protein